MKSRNLFLGLIVLFIGIIALLGALNVIDFSWRIASRLWPFILILIGIAILPVKDYLKAILLLLTMGASVLLYHNEAVNHADRYSLSSLFRNWDWDNDNDNSKDEEEWDADKQGLISEHFSEPYGDYKKATLDIDFGAGNLEILPPCAELVTVNSTSSFTKYNFRTETNDEVANVFVKGKGGMNSTAKKIKNELSVAMSDHPAWDLNINTGASDCDFDLRPYRINHVDIDAGACKMNILLADNGTDITLDVDSGVSDINIEVPSSMGCRISVESALTSKDFPGFTMVNKGLYQTPGFNESEHKIFITFDCGVSTISVSRYETD